MGLGPWAGAAVGENLYRAQIATVVYDTWLRGAIQFRYGNLAQRQAYG